jgi:hypothetical protein
LAIDDLALLLTPDEPLPKRRATLYSVAFYLRKTLVVHHYEFEG